MLTAPIAPRATPRWIGDDGSETGLVDDKRGLLFMIQLRTLTQSTPIAPVAEFVTKKAWPDIALLQAKGHRPGAILKDRVSQADALHP